MNHQYARGAGYYKRDSHVFRDKISSRSVERQLPPEGLKLYLEIAPFPESKCRYCGLIIEQGNYRFAWTFTQKDPENYHVSCLEQFNNLSQWENCRCIALNTRTTPRWSRQEQEYEFNHCYLDGGAERLAFHWLLQRALWTGNQRSFPGYPFKAGSVNLLWNAGSSRFQPMPAAGISMPQQYSYLTTYAPIESDGPTDHAEWSLFQVYLGVDPQNLNDRHHLSSILERWKRDKDYVKRLDPKLNENERRLSRKSIRGITRLSTVLQNNNGIYEWALPSSRYPDQNGNMRSDAQLRAVQDRIALLKDKQ